MKRVPLAGIMIVAALTWGCQKQPPQIEKVEAEKAQPGAPIKVSGSNISPDPSKMTATVAGQKAEVTISPEGVLEIQLPKTLEPGEHDLVITDSATQQTSAPYKLRVTDTVTVPSGTRLVVETVDTIGSQTSRPGDLFALTLKEPLVVKGRLFAEAGSRVTGRIVHVKEPGRVKGRAEIGFTLAELQRRAGEPPLEITTGNFDSRARSTQERDALTIGISTAVGTAIGAIAGGGKGAAIGAATGAAAGTGVVLVTKGDHVEIRSGAVFHVDLEKPVTITIDQPLPVAAREKDQK